MRKGLEWMPRFGANGERRRLRGLHARQFDRAWVIKGAWMVKL